MQATPAVPVPAPALRPMGIGDVVDRVFRIYRDRALALFVLAAIPIVVFIVGIFALTIWFALTLQPVVGLFTGTSDPATLATNPAFLNLLGAMFVYFIAFWLLMLVTGSIVAGAIVDSAAAAHLGRPRGIGASLGVGLRSAPRIFLTGLLASLAIFVFEIVFSIAVSFIQNGLVAFLLSLAYLFVVFFLEASWFIAPAVATIERHGPLASLGRSWQLATGFRWRIVGLGVLLFVLFIVLFILMVVVLGLVSSASRVAGGVLTLVVLFAMIPAWLPLLFGTMTVLYYDLRVRKEGLDLQLAAEAMPRA